MDNNEKIAKIEIIINSGNNTHDSMKQQVYSIRGILLSDK